MACYLIRAGDTSNVKIGYAVDPETRRIELQCGSWEPLVLIRTWDGGDRATEAWLHRQFSHLRTIGEWFYFDPSMLEIEVAVSPGRPRPIAMAIEKAGSATALAKLCGIASQAIIQWKRIPIKHIRAVETLTGLPRHEIRADVYDAPEAA